MKIDFPQIKSLMSDFWLENFRATPHQESLIVTYPLLMPDGLQLYFHISRISETKTLLTDRGKILSWLESQCLSAQTLGIRERIESRTALYEMQYEEGEFCKLTSYPPSPIDIQLFAEGLSAIAHLICRKEERSSTPRKAYETVENIFRTNHIKYKTKASLSAGYERTLRVDFYAKEHGKAIQTISRKNDPNNHLEIWAYRAKDIVRANEGLAMALVYDDAHISPPKELMNLLQAQHTYSFPSSKPDEIEDFLTA